MSSFGLLRLPSFILFGSGQRAALGAMIAGLGSSALVCTDQRLSADVAFREMIDDLKATGITVTIFDRTVADLPLECVDDCLGALAGHVPDFVIGVGGGSCMDLAKAAALLLTHGGRIPDYYGENQIPGQLMPVVAIPTTAGTGSEVTPVLVVGDVERGTKVGVSSPFLIPHIAICDPELTLSCPPTLTAVSGADALTHAMEAYTAATREPSRRLAADNVFVGKNLLSDQFALLAIKSIWDNLYTACTDGSNLDAREQMMLAALTAGCAFGTAGTAAAHALQYPVGNDTHTAHGAGVALLLPYVMEYNRPSCIETFATIARTIGLGNQADSDEGLSYALVDAIAELLASVGIPVTLRDLGLAEARVDWTAQSAVGISRLVNNNPRSIDLDAMRCIAQAAFTGDRSALRS